MINDLTEHVEKLEARIRELEAIEGVRATILRYALAHDRGQSEAVANLFTDDARLEIVGFGSGLDTALSGREAIRKMYHAVDGRFDHNPPSKHVVTNCVISVAGNEAKAITYLDELGGPKTERGPGGSIYQDRLLYNSDGGWRFAHKRIVATSSQTVNDALAARV
jgi:ketosteroid isomerase-like protein